MINNRQAGRRRGRGGQRSQGGNPGRGPENGNRIDNRARGNAAQLHEKYKTLARDAQMQGDRVNTEYYLQFADHYFRVLAETRSRFEENQPRRGQNDQYDDDGDEDFDGNVEPMGDDRVDHYQGDRDGNRQQGRDDGRSNGREHGQSDRGQGDRGQREQGQRDNAQREGGRDRNRDRDQREAVNGSREATNGRSNGERQPRQYQADAASTMADEGDDQRIQQDTGEADRPRRGRPRRQPMASDVRDEPIAIDADRLPPSLSLSASAGGEEAAEEKPKRRRRVTTTEASSVE